MPELVVVATILNTKGKDSDSGLLVGLYTYNDQ